MMVQKWSVQGWVVNGRQAKMTPENHQKILVYLFECFTGKGKGQDQNLCFVQGTCNFLEVTKKWFVSLDCN